MNRKLANILLSLPAVLCTVMCAAALYMAIVRPTLEYRVATIISTSIVTLVGVNLTVWILRRKSKDS
jgi:hypothetical protein